MEIILQSFDLFEPDYSSFPVVDAESEYNEDDILEKKADAFAVNRLRDVYPHM